jgi:hypothetical protein
LCLTRLGPYSRPQCPLTWDYVTLPLRARGGFEPHALSGSSSLMVCWRVCSADVQEGAMYQLWFVEYRSDRLIGVSRYPCLSDCPRARSLHRGSLLRATQAIGKAFDRTALNERGDENDVEDDVEKHPRSGDVLDDRKSREDDWNRPA